MSEEIKRHEMYKELSRHIYHYGQEPTPKGAAPLYIHQNPKNGFFACAYKYQDRIVIVFRGTEDNSDKKTDLNMGIRRIPAQVTDAIYFVKQMKEVIKRDYPGYKLDTTGQSLGGSLSQYSHVLEEGINESVTFQPYGVGHSLNNYLSKYDSKNPVDKITNYCVEKDWISGKLSQTTQIGKCYEIDIKPECKNTDNILKYHKIENLEPLSTRKYKNGGYTHTKPKRNEHQDISECSGSYPVSGYTRDDGTKVEGYTRICYKQPRDIPEKFSSKKFQDLSDDELQEAISYFI